MFKKWWAKVLLEVFTAKKYIFNPEVDSFHWDRLRKN